MSNEPHIERFLEDHITECEFCGGLGFVLESVHDENGAEVDNVTRTCPYHREDNYPQYD